MTLWERLEQAAAPAVEGSSMRFHALRLAVALGLALATYLLFPASPAVEFPLLEIGSVAPDNVIAPFAYRVPKADSALQRERDDLARTVDPIFTYSSSAVDSTRQAIARFDQALGRVSAAADSPDAVAAIMRNATDAGVRLSPAEAAYLSNPTKRGEMIDAVNRAFERWLGRGVAASGALDDARRNITLHRADGDRTISADSVATFSTFVSRARLFHPDAASPVADALYTKLLGVFFHPTLVSDRAATERERQELRKSVGGSKYEVRAGEKIVGAHEVVGRDEHDKMRALRDVVQSRQGANNAIGRVAGAVLFNALVVALLGLTILLFRPRLYASMRVVLLFAAVFLVVLIAAAMLSHVDPLRSELIPIAVAAIIFGVLFDSRISMIAAMILAVLVGGQNAFRGTNALFINLIGGVAAAFSVRVIKRRNDVYHSVVPIAAAYFLAALAIGLTLDWSWRQIAFSAGWGALNALGSVALAMILLAPAERFTGIDTYLSLLEWSDLNRPLMQKLSLEAPGTFDHTIRIANLVEAACNAIGANGLLGRVGAYYHDIGKLKKPQYFVENQPRGRNPHDKLKPSTSASIIRNHVREGLELAQEYKLPRAVAAFITEHHGTSQIAYFLEKAKERDGAAANPGEFVYPGPIPQTAETAVCMLADGVEAATRVIHDPTPQKIRDVVDHIVRQRVEQGQLREAPLTLKQLEIIKDQFARVLTGMYHTRIDYPAASGGVTSEFAPL